MGVPFRTISRIFFLIVQLLSAGAVAATFFFPVFLRSSLNTKIYLLQTCETKFGSERCGSNRESSNVCSEIDSRTRMIITFAVVMGVSNLLSSFIVVWELSGRPVPIRRVQLISTMWTISMNILAVGITVSTLIANLCSSPLNFSEQGGDIGSGSYFLIGALCANLIATLLYVAAPPDSISADEEEDKKERPVKGGKSASRRK